IDSPVCTSVVRDEHRQAGSASIPVGRSRKSGMLVNVGRSTELRKNPMRIATWNVNSVKQRIENLTAWLTERAPDIVCLQETKTVDEAFPRQAVEALGYNVAVHGQKAFNGVAILSQFKFDEVTPRLPGDAADDHARFIGA